MRVWLVAKELCLANLTGKPFCPAQATQKINKINK